MLEFRGEDSRERVTPAHLQLVQEGAEEKPRSRAVRAAGTRAPSGVVILHLIPHREFCGRNNKIK